MRRDTILYLLIGTLLGCGGHHSGGENGDLRTVSISPRTAIVAAGGTLAVTVSETGYADPLLFFDIEETDGGVVGGSGESGPVTSYTGQYVAPATPGTYHVVGTAKERDDTHPMRSSSLTVTVTPVAVE